jgi:hypothetical protein
LFLSCRLLIVRNPISPEVFGMAHWMNNTQRLCALWVAVLHAAPRYARQVLAQLGPARAPRQLFGPARAPRQLVSPGAAAQSTHAYDSTRTTPRSSCQSPHTRGRASPTQSPAQPGQPEDLRRHSGRARPSAARSSTTAPPTSPRLTTSPSWQSLSTLSTESPTRSPPWSGRSERPCSQAQPGQHLPRGTVNSFFSAPCARI